MYLLNLSYFCRKMEKNHVKFIHHMLWPNNLCLIKDLFDAKRIMWSPIAWDELKAWGQLSPLQSINLKSRKDEVSPKWFQKFEDKWLMHGIRGDLNKPCNCCNYWMKLCQTTKCSTVHLNLSWLLHYCGSFNVIILALIELQVVDLLPAIYPHKP